jgi:UDP-glucose 4-epimerase
MTVFKDKTLFITGGTGSFGNVAPNRFLRTDIGDVRDKIVI